MALRFWFLTGCIIAAFAAIVLRLYQLQFTKGGYYSARAESQYLASSAVTANRGLIYFTDRKGSRLPAALNERFPIIYAVPKAIDDAAEAANVLGPILTRPVADLEKIFSKKSDTYELLQRKADPALARQVEDLNIKGIYVDMLPGRFYPLGSLASHLIGFAGPSKDSAANTGHYGVEEFYDAKLNGGFGANTQKGTNPDPQTDLILTIDPNIQTEAEKVLQNLIADQHADGGTVIVADPQTGKILAMESWPGFDPNSYASSSIASFLNPATQQVYEPGSVFKVLTMAIGIDARKLTPETTYFDKGTVTLNGRTISNYDLKTHGPYGTVTMTNVIEHSINTGAVHAERLVGRTIFTDYLHRFGFSEKTGVDLPGEVTGNLKRLNPKERDIAFATASYGQGVAVTPLELISAIAAIANGGNLMRPYVNADLAPSIIRRVISAETAEKVTGMMVSAVDKASVASISGYSIAGKTGTAFIPDFVHGGYSDRVITSYVGFGPTKDPKFIILLKLNDLPSTALAATNVVPAFRELAQFVLNYYNIQPDRINP
ncbi:MAG: penicillin-binding protein 2 [Candidatus Liptonbacteria bacterium]|nr:penicillin-binding protein 2 [Candidatus Liptonbacteria bacterium]